MEIQKTTEFDYEHAVEDIIRIFEKYDATYGEADETIYRLNKELKRQKIRIAND